MMCIAGKIVFRFSVKRSGDQLFMLIETHIKGNKKWCVLYVLLVDLLTLSENHAETCEAHSLITSPSALKRLFARLALELKLSTK